MARAKRDAPVYAFIIYFLTVTKKWTNLYVSWSRYIFKKTHTTTPRLEFSLLSYLAYFSNESSKFWIKYWHYKYGNCFIFNSGKAAPIFKSNKPGPSHGMVI